MVTTPAIEAYETELPANVSAEKAILGAILLDNTYYYETTGDYGLQPDDFSLESHKRIFARMAELLSAQQSVDIVTLSNLLAMHREIVGVGGVAYLASLTEGLPRRPRVEEYARIVKDKSLCRRLMIISSQAIARASDQSETALEVYGATLGALEEAAVGHQHAGRGIAQILAEDWPQFEAEASAPQGGTLGASLFSPEISRTTCGIQEGELALLCARPGQGKTEAAVQVMVENARRGLRIHMHSLEMKAHRITRRMVRYMAKVPIKHMRDPRCLLPDERRALRLAKEELADLPIFIDDQHELTVAEYRSRCVLAAKRWKADLIVCDYAQLLIVPRAKNIIEAAPKQAETLRHIARDYCRTLALAQLRRTPPNDLNRHPDIEDILGSSAFEQAAQIILLLHRSRKEKRYTGEDYCFVAKMREMPGIYPLGISAETWGGFKDRDEVQEGSQPERLDWR